MNLTVAEPVAYYNLKSFHFQFYRFNEHSLLCALSHSFGHCLCINTQNWKEFEITWVASGHSSTPNRAYSRVQTEQSTT